MVSAPLAEAVLIVLPITGAGGAMAYAVDAVAFLRMGGPVIAVLCGLSVVATAIVFLKLWQFHRFRLGERQTIAKALQLYRSGQTVKALALAQGSRNPVAQAVARAWRGRARDLPESQIREDVKRYGDDALFQLRALLSALDTIASLAPLLGLFGTVLGMIAAFQQMEAAGSQVNPAILSGGIWQALLTTAAGLAVAMPVAAVSTWLERRVDTLAHAMNMAVSQVFTEDLSAAQSPMEAPTSNDVAMAVHASAPT